MEDLRIIKSGRMGLHKPDERTDKILSFTATCAKKESITPVDRIEYSLFG